MGNEIAQNVNNFPVDEADACLLDILPNELLLYLLRFLPTIDLLSICKVNRRLNDICVDSALLRYADFQKCYRVTPHALEEVACHSKRTTVQSLNISHCFWLTGHQTHIGALNPLMPHLECLDIRGISVSLKTLNRILSCARSLRSLSYEHPGLVQSRQFSKQALATWSQLTELNVVVTSNCLHGAIFWLCTGLRAFSLATSHQALGSHTCLCDDLLFSRLPLHQLEYLSVAEEAAAQHPRSCQWKFLRWRVLLGQMKALCVLPSLLAGNLRDAPDWDTDPGCAPILSLEMDTHCHFATLESRRLQSIRHLGVELKHRCLTHEFLTSISKFSHLRSLNISGFFAYTHNRVFKDKEDFLMLVKVLVEAQIPLEHLNMSNIRKGYLHEQGTTNCLGLQIGQLRGLKSLALPICGLADQSQSQPVWMTSSQESANPDGVLDYHTTSSNKRQRVGSKARTYIMCENCLAEVECPGGQRTLAEDSTTNSGRCIYCGSNLAQVVSGTPLMECLDLQGGRCTLPLSVSIGSLGDESKSAPCPPSSFPSVSEDTLLCISRWTRLRSLVLGHLPTFLHGHSLVAIAKHCKQLRHLSLIHLGRSGQCQFLAGLCEALSLANCLEDLKLEHDNIDGVSRLFHALEKCPSITRLCVVSKNGSVKLDDVIRLFDHCPKLVVLFLLCSLTVAACKSLKQELTLRFGADRLALRLAIGKYPSNKDSLKECLKGMPDVHIREVFLGSEVAAPPSWDELQADIQQEARE
ncbi:uncharacterized protein LOC110974074 isoform X1 [Acanthaster planci]|uniref:Uncharacterized protein LOC110974074 isoform X1 n=1 Tax=Acanthaster planci TaxID=133434 RepID=A0A8B7XJX1_ACAPL|nr:uncharacterized protein LOC110974074 isoform X1 [Acanthaster planci]